MWIMVKSFLAYIDVSGHRSKIKCRSSPSPTDSWENLAESNIFSSKEVQNMWAKPFFSLHETKKLFIQQPKDKMIQNILQINNELMGKKDNTQIYLQDDAREDGCMSSLVSTARLHWNCSPIFFINTHSTDND